MFLSSRHIAKDKVGPIEEPRHVVVQPILRPTVAGVGVIQPENRDRHISEAESENSPSPSKSPLRTKGKGLLERFVKGNFLFEVFMLFCFTYMQ